MGIGRMIRITIYFQVTVFIRVMACDTATRHILFSNMIVSLLVSVLNTDSLQRVAAAARLVRC